MEYRVAPKNGRCLTQAVDVVTLHTILTVTGLGKMRGLFRYQTASDRWWACVEDDKGERVNIVRNRYDLMKIKPPFDTLPVEDNGSKKSKRS